MLRLLPTVLLLVDRSDTGDTSRELGGAAQVALVVREARVVLVDLYEAKASVSLGRGEEMEEETHRNLSVGLGRVLERVRAGRMGSWYVELSRYPSRRRGRVVDAETTNTGDDVAGLDIQLARERLRTSEEDLAAGFRLALFELLFVESTVRIVVRAQHRVVGVGACADLAAVFGRERRGRFVRNVVGDGSERRCARLQKAVVSTTLTREGRKKRTMMMCEFAGTAIPLLT